jgi:hypothetical protein
MTTVPRLARLAIPLLSGWIFAGGVGTMILTMSLCRLYHPEEFAGSVPTISKAAELAPEKAVFTIGMASVGLCILLAWISVYFYNRRNILRCGRPGLAWFNRLALLLGALEGASVAGLGLFNMDDALVLHMASSYGTFFTGAFAFLTDSFGTARWQPAAGSGAGRHRRPRRFLALAVAAVGCFFFAVFLTKDGDPFGNHLLTRLFYVGAELALGALSFAYAPLYGVELAGDKGLDTVPDPSYRQALNPAPAGSPPSP